MNLGILFGGNSLEHDISIISAFQLKNKLSKVFNVVMIYCDFEANIYNVSKNKLDDFKKDKNKFKKTRFVNGGIKNKKIDLMVLIGHGENSEDGVFAGLMRFYNICFLGSDIFASSLSIDKWNSYLFLREEIPFINKISYNKNDYINKKEIPFMPAIIKPRFGGSSIGIEICNTKEELDKLLIKELNDYNELIIEPFMNNIEEYTQAVSHNYISKIEVIKKKEYYSFESKYTNDNKFILKDYIVDSKLNELSKKIYKLINASGIIRIDYFKINDRYFVNEINTLPGALASYLFDNFDDVILDEMKYSFNNKVIKYNSLKFLKNSNIQK